VDRGGRSRDFETRKQGIEISRGDQNLPAPTASANPQVHMTAQGKTADALLSKLLQYQLAPQFVAVIEDVTESAAGFQESLASAIKKDDRGLWILTTQSGGQLLSELAQVVKHHVVL
jgi:hypothetical protein